MCAALGNTGSEVLAKAGPEALASIASEFLARQSGARRLRDLGVAREALVTIRDFALRNFNADRRRELRHEVPRLDATLEAAW